MPKSKLLKLTDEEMKDPEVARVWGEYFAAHNAQDAKSESEHLRRLADLIAPAREAKAREAIEVTLEHIRKRLNDLKPS